MLLLSAALSLLEKGREHAAKGDDKRDHKQDQPHGAPQGDVARRTGLTGDVGIGQTAGDKREQQQRSGKNEEISSHGSIKRDLTRRMVSDLARP